MAVNRLAGVVIVVGPHLRVRVHQLNHQLGDQGQGGAVELHAETQHAKPDTSVHVSQNSSGKPISIVCPVRGMLCCWVWCFPFLGGVEEGEWAIHGENKWTSIQPSQTEISVSSKLQAIAWL